MGYVLLSLHFESNVGFECSWFFLQNPKMCGFYRFQREYLDVLMEKKIIRICCEQIEELGEEVVEAAAQDEGMKQLENKMERMMWKFNIFIVCIE